MSSNSRFLFENEFASATLPQEVVKKAELLPAVYTEEQYQAAISSAFEDGRRQGDQTVRDEWNDADNALLETINQQVGSLNESQSQAHSNVKAEAAKIALMAARKLAAALIDKSAITEIHQLVDDCLRDLIEEPRVVLRASEQICEDMKSRIDLLTQNSGFQGQLILLPDDRLSGADCRVEWADGGAQRNEAEITDKLSAIVDRYVNSLTA